MAGKGRGPDRADPPHYWRLGAPVLGFAGKGERAMGPTRRLLSEVVRIALSLAFVCLVGVATARIGSPLFFAILLSAGLAIAFIPALFPASRLFSIAFANLIAVYAAIFSLFVGKIFAGVDASVLGIGFCLPVFFFVAGCWLRQDEVRAVVAHPHIRSERRLFAALVWLVPITLVGGTVFLLSHLAATIANTDLVLLVAMTVIGLIVLAVSRDVAIFLVDAGLLFEEFFARIARLVIPAFAFLTFYSLLVILFASAYRILSAYTGGPHFYVGDAPHALSFSEFDLFLHRQHHHARLWRHRAPFEPCSPAGLDRGHLRLHAALVRRVGALGIYARASPPTRDEDRGEDARRAAPEASPPHASVTPAKRM